QLDHTPYFASQAPNTEVFCNITESIRTTIAPFLGVTMSNGIPAAKDEDEKKPSLLDLARDASGQCSTKEETDSFISSFVSAFNSDLLGDRLGDLYDAKASSIKDGRQFEGLDLLAARQIGDWL